jgi:hypothetical protein
METVTALKRIILALALVLSFGLHQAMQCQGASIVYAASDPCSHQQSCPHRSSPASPVEGCCANSAWLSDAQCSGVDKTAVSRAVVAQLQPVSASVSIFPSAAAAHSPSVALRLHSPPAQVPFFVIHHSFLI